VDGKCQQLGRTAKGGEGDSKRPPLQVLLEGKKILSAYWGGRKGHWESRENTRRGERTLPLFKAHSSDEKEVCEISREKTLKGCLTQPPLKAVEKRLASRVRETKKRGILR